MGLSLPGLGKKLEDILGGAAGAVVHQAAPITQVPGAVTNFGVNTVKGISNALLVRPAAGTFDAAKAALGGLTGNQVAEQNALAGLKNDFTPAAALGQGLLRTAPQVIETARHPFSSASYTPNTPLERAAFGSTPVQNIQGGVVSNFNQHAGLPIIPRVALAAGYGGAQLAQDIPVVGGAAKVALKGADAAKVVNATLGEEGSIKLPPKTSSLSARTTQSVRAQRAVTHGQFGYDDYAAQAKEAGTTPISQEQYNTIFKTPQETTPKEQFLRSAEENTALNPTKKTIPAVAPGDFEQARLNPGIASAPISHATIQAVGAIKRLSPSDKADFLDTVEHPERIKNAKDPEKMRQAVTAHNNMTNLIHATSQSLGGNTNFIKNYVNHNIDTATPEQAQNLNLLTKFAGLNRKNRVFSSREEAKAAGFSFKTDDPVKATLEYGNQSAQTLHKAALVKAVTEADAPNLSKLEQIDFHDGNPLPVSREGLDQLRGFQHPNGTPNPLVRTYRTANGATKHVLLTASQYHPVNINVLQGAPALVMTGHPLRALRGLTDTALVAVPKIGKVYGAKLAEADAHDGVTEAAAHMGTPLGSHDFSGNGGGLVFGRQIPAMHSQMVRAAMEDLGKKGLSVDDPEAHTLGTSINHVMGFINTEAQNLDPRVQRVFSDFLLAPQFERAKLNLLRDALQPGLAGNYARGAVFGKYATEVGLSLGVGQATGQNSNNLMDNLIQDAISPAIPTGLKDSKGNNVKFKLPDSGASEVANLVLNSNRDNNGRLKIGLNNPATAANTVATDARNKLAVVPGDIAKVATNTSYAGKVLSDPNAPIGTRLQQIGATLGADSLPIGVQGLAYTKPVENLLPKGAREVLQANSPGTNPLVKSALSAVAATPETDTTTGKGLQTSQYYNALDAAKKGLNAQETDAINLFTGSKKNPVTGKYDVTPSVEDSPAKASVLLQNPKVIDHLITLNQTLASQGQQVDPLWQQSKDKITAYLQYQTINKDNTQALTAWKQNNPWYSGFEQQRSVFFNSLPPGDPNKLQNPIQPPASTPDVDTAFQQYDSITDPTQKAQFFGAHPELSDYLDQLGQYTNQVLKAQGLPQLKPYPTADPQTSSYTSTYMNGDTAQRAALRSGNPEGYANMQAYLQNVDEYEVAKNGALDQLQGQTPDQELLKGINSLGNYDMVTNPDGSLALKYGSVNPGATTYGSVAAPPAMGAVSTGGSGSSTASFDRKMRNISKTLKIKAFKPKLNARNSNIKYAIAKAHHLPVTATARARKRPKVSLKAAKA